jgi:hypothetical protein
MTLFGQTFDGQQIAGLVSLLGVLVLWIFVWRGDRRQSAWLRQWNAERKARREAEEAGAKPASDRKGPWG